MKQRPPSVTRDLLTGISAGLLAMGATAWTDRALGRLVSKEQKIKEKRVRKGSPHDVAGPMLGRQLLGRRLKRREKRRARAIFSAAYGVGWGLVYSVVRRKLPRASAAGGLPFAVPFFLACDGAIAPLLGFTPGLNRVPWQLSAKELGNHVAWTAGAEAVHRLARKLR